MKEWSNLASVVYRRTYARKDNGHLENWEETVTRAIMGNVKGHNVPEQEIKDLIQLALERKAGPAGRGYWYSGTKSHERIGGVALNNCWFLTASEWENFVIAQDLLMLGGGVGFSVERQFTDKLPKIKKDVTITSKATKDADFIIPDSREGWCTLTRMVLESFFVTGRSFSYSTICIRGYGEPIVGFGGVASGPLPLTRFIAKLSTILSSRAGKQMRPIDAADVLTATGEMVVAGNVRRSAILIQGDCFDKDYLKAKRWDLDSIPTHRSCANYSVVCDDIEDLHPLFWKTYEQGEPFGIVNRTNMQKYGRMGELKADSAIGVNPCQPAWATVLTPKGQGTIGELAIGDTIWSGKRWTKITNKWSTGEKEVFAYHVLSGSTLYCTKDHRVLCRGIKLRAVEADGIDDTSYKFQPIVNVTSSGVHEVFDITVDDEEHTYSSGDLVVSNCGEAALENGEPCNLSEMALNNIESVEEFIKAARLMHRYTKRVTLERYHHKLSDDVIKRNRRTGNGITGCLASPLFNPETLDRAYAAIQEEDESYSKELGIPRSKRTTVVKPSGTMSKVLDCMGYEGIHAAYSRYFIQRIRFAANDSLIPRLRAAGHYIEPIVKFDGTLDHQTLVADFYVSAPNGYPVADEDWDTWKQLDILKMAQRHWADQSVSVTVYYKREDLSRLKEWLSLNLQDIKTISFLCHSDHGFKQAPKETITREQYERLSSKIRPLDLEDITEGGILEGTECEGGVCPVR